MWKTNAHRDARNRYAHRADALLQCMELFRNIDPKDSNAKLPYKLPHPDFHTYQSVLSLYGRTDGLSAEEGPERCQAVVKRMEQQSHEFGDLSLRPSSFAWNQVLQAWSTCTHPEKAFFAANLLQHLKRDGLCDDFSYNHVIAACAFSSNQGRSKKLGSQVAIKVWHEMISKDIRCTSRSFHFYLTACSYILDAKQRDHEVEAAFCKCRDEGKVSNYVLKSMKQAASPALQEKLLGDHQAANDAAKFPSSWTRNAD